MVSDRRRALRWCAAAFLCGAIQLASPVKAYAFWEWLDNLGPGHLNGGHFDIPLFCFAEPPKWEDAAVATVDAYALVQKSTGRASRDDVFAHNTLEDWRKVIGDGTDRERILMTAEGEIARVQASLGATATPEVLEALSRAAFLWRQAWQEAAQPRVGILPGAFFDARCTDRPKNSRDVPRSIYGKPKRGLAISYWELYLWNPNAPQNADFSGNEQIHMRVVEPKFLFPLSGSRDVLDGSSGAGVYWMSSSKFPMFNGWILEPIRLSLHVPSSWVESQNGYKHLAAPFSFVAGVLVFPGGFSEGRFVPTSPAQPKGEVVLELGFDIDFGRFWRP